MPELKYFQSQEDFLAENRSYNNKINPKTHAEELVMILAKSMGVANNLFQALSLIHRLNNRMVSQISDVNKTLTVGPLIKWLSNFNDNNRRKILTWFRNNPQSHKELIRVFNIKGSINGFIHYYNENFTGDNSPTFFEGLKLHNIQNGKLLISWMVSNTTVNSDNYYYDLGIGDSKIEVKDFSKRKTPLDEIKIQLISKTKIGRYDFWSEMGRTILHVKKIKPELEDLRDKLVNENWKSDENNVLRKFLRSCFFITGEDFLEEFDSGDFENMNNWEKMYNLFIHCNDFLKFKKERPGEGVYDYVKFISSARENKPILFDVEPIEISDQEDDTPDEITLKIKKSSEIEKLVSYLRVEILKFKYARNPIDWVRDILAAEESVRNTIQKVNIVLITPEGVRLITGQGSENLIFNTVGGGKLKISYLDEEPRPDLANYKNGVLSQPFMKNIWSHR